MTTGHTGLIWINGELKPTAEATVSVFDHGLLYGGIDPATIPIAVALFERYATGTISMEELADEFSMTEGAVTMILRNPIYNGWVHPLLALRCRRATAGGLESEPARPRPALAAR